MFVPVEIVEVSNRSGFLIVWFFCFFFFWYYLVNWSFYLIHRTIKLLLFFPGLWYGFSSCSHTTCRRESFPTAYAATPEILYVSCFPSLFTQLSCLKNFFYSHYLNWICTITIRQNWISVTLRSLFLTAAFVFSYFQANFTQLYSFVGFRHPVKLNGVLWSCEAPIGNLTDNSIGCHDNLLILFDRFVEFPDALTEQWAELAKTAHHQTRTREHEIVWTWLDSDFQCSHCHPPNKITVAFCKFQHCSKKAMAIISRVPFISPGEVR